MPVTETHTILEPLGAKRLSDLVGQRVRIAFEGHDDGAHSWRGTESGLYLGVVRSDHDGKPMHLFVDGEIRGVPQASFGFPCYEVALSEASSLEGSTSRVQRYWHEGESAPRVGIPWGAPTDTGEITCPVCGAEATERRGLCRVDNRRPFGPTAWCSEKFAGGEVGMRVLVL